MAFRQNPYTVYDKFSNELSEFIIDIVRLTSQSRNIPEVAILGGKRISMARVAVFSAATIVEFRGATYVFSLYGYSNQSFTRNASFEQQTTGTVDLQPN